MNEYKRFVQRIGLVGITNILISISGLIFIPIITKNFSVFDYGIWAQVNTTIALIPNIANLGLPYTMVRFLSAENDKSKIKESFYSMLAVVFASSLIISLLFIIFKNPIADSLFGGNINILYLVSIISFFACMNLMIISFFRTFQQIKRYSLFLVLQSYIGVLISSYLALSGYNIETVVLGLLVGYLAVFIIMLLMIGGYLGLAIPKFKNLKEELEFAIPTIPSNVSSWVVDSSDKYVIGIFIGSAAVGYYSPSYALGSILLMFLSPFALLLPAVLPKYFEEGNLKQVNIFLKYSMKYFMIITVPAAVGLSILSKPILLIITTPEIALNGYLITPFVCLGAIFMGMYGITNNILILEKKTKILGKIWILVGFLNLLFNIIAVPFIGIIGAAIVTLLCYLIALLITVFYSRKYLELPYDYISMIKIAISSIIMGIVVAIINPNGIWNVLITIIIGILVYFLVLFLIKGINKEELNFFKTMINES
ncbi:polysaccharide biosynthesis protein [Methanobrevibacter arboriphilus]|jgi:O-antigen/teichoic acid export membrane protein|uniref:Polysaccharide biosynthesis protein n=1 Tax=Methanobrevibacter arboriphilus TaxID=39441 RepID=A0ACA8R518_METAZ|nr:polysaccharide biosynthesis C-terminal domain-containing protein [Methanobrevibacter arboriphilus]BBL62604.1 polysaccharide biosynthesis protein [Methanobrevibacter arboriphilus]GLI12683.1 polysaccharide biosynthesis protein [Methanobrevibacter arboriphilus]